MRWRAAPRIRRPAPARALVAPSPEPRGLSVRPSAGGCSRTFRLTSSPQPSASFWVRCCSPSVHGASSSRERRPGAPIVAESRRRRCLCVCTRGRRGYPRVCGGEDPARLGGPPHHSGGLRCANEKNSRRLVPGRCVSALLCLPPPEAAPRPNANEGKHAPAPAADCRRQRELLQPRPPVAFRPERLPRRGQAEGGSRRRGARAHLPGGEGGGRAPVYPDARPLCACGGRGRGARGRGQARGHGEGPRPRVPPHGHPRVQVAPDAPVRLRGAHRRHRRARLRLVSRDAPRSGGGARRRGGPGGRAARVLLLQRRGARGLLPAPSHPLKFFSVRPLLRECAWALDGRWLPPTLRWTGRSTSSAP